MPKSKLKEHEQAAEALVLPPNFDLSAVTLEVLLILDMTGKSPHSTRDIAFALSTRNHVRSEITRMVETVTIKVRESSS